MTLNRRVAVFLLRKKKYSLAVSLVVKHIYKDLRREERNGERHIILVAL